MSSRHRSSVYDDNQNKKRHKHHKKYPVDDLHKKKRRHGHDQKENNEEELKRKHYGNNYLENWLINFLKDYNEELNNNFSLEKKPKDKKKDLVSDNNLEVNMGERYYLRGSHHSIEEEYFQEESNDNMEERYFLRGSHDNIDEEDFLQESHDTIKEDFLQESHDTIKEGFLEENHDNIEEEDFLKGSNDIIEEDLPKEIYETQVDEYTIINCKAKATSEILPTCENVSHTSEVTAGPVTVKIPVVLTECTVTITVESFLKLEDVILEIKHIKKNVYLNQCELIQSSEDFKSNTGRLFLDGFIKSDIEYTTNTHKDEYGAYGTVKHVIVKVPFKCTTIARFKTDPKFKQSTYQDETEILQTSIKVFHACGEGINGSDMREQSFKVFEFFNEKVFCELTSAEILESSILENPVHKECKVPSEWEFHDISEKVVLLLTIKLLQNQHVEIQPKYEK